jgi:hypothetical protein
MSEQQYEIHISDVRTFRQCRRKWWFSSLMPGCKGLEPRVPYAPFFEGRAVHDVLSVLYETGEHPVDVFHQWIGANVPSIEEEAGPLWEAERAKVQESVDRVEGMLEHYAVWRKHYHGPNADENLRFLATEMEFKIPLPGTPFIMGGRFDGVVQRPNDGTYWLFETKTTRSINELVRSLANDEQAGLYAWAAQQIIGEPISGIIYNLLRKKIPNYPHGLRDGSLTRNKGIDTTLELYWEAAKESHPLMSIEELKEYYMDMLLHLESKGNTFFMRHEVRRTQAELEQLIVYLLATAEEMSSPNTVLYPSPGWMTCNFCHFRAPCLAMNSGADFDFILEHEYQSREPFEHPQENEDA